MVSAFGAASIMHVMLQTFHTIVSAFGVFQILHVMLYIAFHTTISARIRTWRGFSRIKHKALTQSGIDVGSASSTVDQYQINFGSMHCVCFKKVVKARRREAPREA